jgi:hypothetical protein
MGSKPLMRKKDDKNTVIALREIAHGLVEQLPLSELEEETHVPEAATPEDEFSLIFDSPDLNVVLDTDQDEEEEKKAKKGEESDEEDDLEDWEEEEEEEEE